MKRVYRLLAGIFLLSGVISLTGVAAALDKTTPVVEQFAQGLHLEASGAHGLYELALPLAVYQGVTRADLGDLRVFNRAGSVVPHALRPAERPRVQPDKLLLELPFFPIRGRSGQQLGGVALHIERRGEGQTAIVDVRVEGAEVGESAVTIGYLVEVWDDESYRRRQSRLTGSAMSAREQGLTEGGGGDPGVLTELACSWQAEGGDLVQHLTVEGSDDLLHWHQVGSGTIADLRYQGHRLQRDTIELGRSNDRYLRLSWPAEQSPPQLTQLRGTMENPGEVPRPAGHWYQAQLRELTSEPGSYLIDLQGSLPVSGVRIRLAEKNSLYAASLSSRPAPGAPWQTHWQDLLYDLEVNGEGFSNPVITLPDTGHRYWRLSIADGETRPLSQPRVEFAWQPARLLFLAQGAGPFLLAYGSAVVEPGSFEVNGLLARYQSSKGRQAIPEPIAATTPVVLGGPARLQPPPPPLPWRTYILWAVLTLGVGLIGAMARHLYRQLQEAADDQP